MSSEHTAGMNGGKSGGAGAGGAGGYGEVVSRLLALGDPFYECEGHHGDAAGDAEDEAEGGAEDAVDGEDGEKGDEDGHGHGHVHLHKEELDFVGMGLGGEHVGELLRMACDKGLLARTDESDPLSWGPMHALDALADVLSHAREKGQAVSVNPAWPTKLMELGEWLVKHEQDYLLDSWLGACIEMGPAVVKPALGRMVNGRNPVTLRLLCIEAAELVAQEHAEVRGEVVGALMAQLKQARLNVVAMNDVLCLALRALGVAEAEGLIDAAYQGAGISEAAYQRRDVPKE
ncbi:MAG: hypothetical protein LW650_13160 [Planctomycetaceae bacterium]|jgi:hypothetical protein|nr:hypothetical protein [Phycisphaerales bacterium]MCE2654357.1 hypothetical protein [Planctomycetaceae bacterium]